MQLLKRFNITLHVTRNFFVTTLFCFLLISENAINYLFLNMPFPPVVRVQYSRWH